MKLRLASWNVNGIRSVHSKGAFDVAVSSLEPDVLCLQEIKAEPHQVELELEGYGLHWHPAERKGYSGTAIFSKLEPIGITRGLPARTATRYGLREDPYGDANTEGRVVTAEFEDFYLVTVYTPNVKGDLSRLGMRHDSWDPAFLSYVKSLKKKKPVAICGDLNVAHGPDDLANPKANEGNAGYTEEERHGFEQLLRAGFVDSFRLFTEGNGPYTWWSFRSAARERNVGWRIDYFLVSQDLADKVVAAEIHAGLEGSDHCPVSITLEL